MNVQAVVNPKLHLQPLVDQSTPVGRLIGKLIAVYPAQISGKGLASEVPTWDTGNAFASLCFHFHRANEALAPYGWQVGRSGGEPHSTYVLRPIRGPFPARSPRRA